MLPNEKKADSRPGINTLLRAYPVDINEYVQYPKNIISHYIIMANQLIKDAIDKVTEGNATERQKYIMYRKLNLKVEIEKMPHTMITIQFDEAELEMPVFNLVNELENLKWLKANDWWYSYEYHSKEYPDGGNLHAHLLVRQSQCQLNKTKILRDIKRRYKEQLKVVNYQHSTSKEHFDNRLAYIKGDKDSLDKLGFCEKDRVWRTENKILPYYTNA